MNDLRFKSSQGQENWLSSSKRSDRLWFLPRLSSVGAGLAGFFPGGKKARA
jgi:hypothetical protein